MPLHRHQRRAVLATFAGLAAVSCMGSAMAQETSSGSKWVSSWATAIQGPYIAPTAPQGPAIGAFDGQPDLRFALPNASTDGVADQTMRMIVKPDVWGGTVRVRFSNAFGTKPVTFSAATVALQEYQANLVPGTAVRVTFAGKPSLTVQPGKQVFSDAVRLPFVTPAALPLLRGRNLAISFAVAGKSGPASMHRVASVTNYISPPGSGDVTGAEHDAAFPYSTNSTFFISQLDVVAPQDTRVIAALGDSITDGTFSTPGGNDRWSDAMSRRLHTRYGDRVSIVNLGIASNTVASEANSAFGGPPATRRLARDVLSLSGLDTVVWLEGINDLSSGSEPDAVIAGYRQVVAQLHDAKVKVIGATITSSLIPNDKVLAASPLVASSSLASAKAVGSAKQNRNRQTINRFILTSGLFDGTADFAAVTTDPDTSALKAPFVPNSAGSAGDYLHPNRAGYQAMGQAAAEAIGGMIDKARR